MMRGVNRSVFVITMIVGPTLAVADPNDAPPNGASADSSHLDLALRSQIGFGASIQPNVVSISSDGGYDGAAGKATGDIGVEAKIWRGFSIRASAELGGLTKDNGRPAIGGAYQFLDPYKDPVGLRVSVTYKPEGFTEPEGEIESVAVVSKLIGKDSFRGFAAFGGDPDFNESDGELGASYLHAFGDSIVAGAAGRVRDALKVKAGSGEPNWDITAGAIAAILIQKGARIEAFVGDETINITSTKSGILGLLGVGLDL